MKSEKEKNAMQTLYLPHHPENLDLPALNKRLRAGTLCLDWSDVEASLSPVQLAILLSGLNLTEHADLIGVATVPSFLQQRMLMVLQAQQDEEQIQQTNKRADKQPEPSRARKTKTPILWLPEETHLAEESPISKESLVVQEEIAPEFPEEETVRLPAIPPIDTDATAIRKNSTSRTRPSSPSASESPSAQNPNPGPQPATILAAEVPNASQLREKLEAMVLRDLLGPARGEEEEVDEDRVRDRYLIGMLAPNKTQTSPEEMDELALADEGGSEDENRDSDASQKPTFRPASLGMSFCIDQETPELLVTVSWGQYLRDDSETLKNKKGNPQKIWKRQPRSGQQRIQLQEGILPYWRPAEEEQPDIYVRTIVRRSGESWLVSLFLVNGQKEPKQLRDSAWIFQPEMSVEAPDGTPIFKRRLSARQHRLSADEKAMAMRYRHHVSFAVGHGVSIHANTLPTDPTCAVRLSTSVAPTYDIPLTEAPTSTEIPALATLVLDMQDLAMTGASALPAKLQPLISAYTTWIDEQEKRISDPTTDLREYQQEAESTIQLCRKTLTRIQAGITLLTTSRDAAQAFSFMNQAMWLQRIHTIFAEERQQNSELGLRDVDLPRNRSWRPFQLAFILLNIPALTDLHHQDRQEDVSAIADLLWFPTGGGKTEAYLGLTAYTLGIRRLQGVIEGRSGEEGVAVIMRYTLRLLTLQQFQRASTLICACEMIRRGNSATWGTVPFRLGLWVGLRSTPNTTEESSESVKLDHHIYSSNFAGVGSPRQLTRCPWCGETIDAGKNIDVESYSKGRARTLIYCSDPYGRCPFSQKQAHAEGLPVLVVDEEIYRLLPSLLIATVDKFAQLPWKGETQMLFGQVEKQCERHGFRSADIQDSDRHVASGKFPLARSHEHAPLRPPDLIIQDELHLIAGPLGSLVGLYETVIDHLSTWEVAGKKVRPKVIAATATIRRADQQIRNLFMRDMNIFPPQGLDAEDNFFSRQRPPSEETPGRRYLGICANGRRLKAALIRVYVAHLSAAQLLYNTYGAAAADPWLTLVGYFNSMSELGGMRRLVDDDVSSRLWKMGQRGLAQRRKPIVEELTSRKSSNAIPEVLSKLEQTFVTEKPRPIDVLLATNMISVGVDIKRLGLMVVTGQPKTTAEYIQATSRVGRLHPGLVCVVYNWSRPRDLSHYEQFEHYHATFYQQVEALSVTPFAPRALDRGLAALLTSYIRLSDPTYSKNEAAGSASEASERFTEAIAAITHRAEEVTQKNDAIERVQRDLLRLQRHWLTLANKEPALGYKNRRDGKTLALLKDPEPGNWELFTCLNSLRDVEPTVNLVLDERGLGTNEADTLEVVVAEVVVEEQL